MYRRSALTLVELVVIAIFLGILAAVVVPRFAPASTQPQTNALEANLTLVRNALELYRTQHNQAWPTVEAFASQLTLPTSLGGVPASSLDEKLPFGPYIHMVPNNPFTGTNTVGSGAIGTSAWYYNPITGEFRANDSAEHHRL